MQIGWKNLWRSSVALSTRSGLCERVSFSFSPKSTFSRRSSRKPLYDGPCTPSPCSLHLCHTYKAASSRYLPGYTGGPDVNKAVKYIKEQFARPITTDSRIYVMFVFLSHSLKYYFPSLPSLLIFSPLLIHL
jgi:hypothetical protein